MRAELWTSADAYEHTFFTAGHIIGAYTPQYFSGNEKFTILEQKVATYPVIWRKRYQAQLTDMATQFGYGQTCLLVDQQTLFADFLTIYADPATTNALDYFSQHRDLIHQFMPYFRENAAELILQATQRKTLIYKPLESVFINNPNFTKTIKMTPSLKSDLI